VSYRIETAAIIGAGTMGGGIAAHLANIGIPVVLLDIPTPNLLPAEQHDPHARNRLVESLFNRTAKAKPANLARPDRAGLITIGNTDDDLDKVAGADWIVEVVIEQLAPKRQLMQRLEALRKPGSLVSSNTSGIPIHLIAEGRSADFKRHFLGTHFFNPPRYLKLLEIIPTLDTAPDVVEFMVAFGRDVLGKGVVVCKDTPNFIGNRFFALAASYATERGLADGYTVPEIDAITGPLIGRPKTASFRLLDLVGLDVMGHVNNNLYDAIPHDPYRAALRGPKTTALVEHMLANKWLGNKTGQGFYKQASQRGQREFLALNPASMAYEPVPPVRFDSVEAVQKIDDLGQRLAKLLQHGDRAANYARDILYYGFAYAAYVAPEITYKLSDIDDAMRWGFAHQAGPFQIWDMLGVAETAAKMEAAGFEVAGWVKELLASGQTSFYHNGQVYDFSHKTYQPLALDPKAIFVKDLHAANKEVARNDSASLLDMGDGVAVLEFHSKLNAIDPDIVALANIALDRLRTDFEALVIGNNGQDFCVGANIALVGVAAEQGRWDVIEREIRATHDITFRLRHAPKPVVTAPHQRVLGGGVEFTMAGWTAVADHETYMGFVEVGVGIIPAAGGCKELLRRKVNPVMRTANADVLPPLQAIFTQVATAQVSTSAWEARDLGYLLDSDTIVMNGDQRLARAKQKALALVAAGARPPEVEKVYAAGRDALNVLKLGVLGFVWGNNASEYDAHIGRKLAYVLCGGDLSAGTWVDPWYILDLEREALISLLGEQKTRDRMAYMLKTGKPLRN
jgi:3-hydroxyacyl-CoA dehydrogenase